MKNLRFRFRQFLSFIILVLFAFGSFLKAQEAPPLKADADSQKLIAELEELVPELMKKADIPGMSIAVIKDGKIIWTEGFGIKNTKTGEAVTKDTIFEAASLTKPFFAYMAMQLVERGELDLDKPLHEYIPQEVLVKKYIRHPWDLEGFNRDWFRRVTARLVLSHSSGLPHGEPRRPLPILFEPGSRYKYSADGYQYLQQVIEHLKGEPLKDLMVKAALEPLGMEHSSMVWQKRYEAQAAVGHDVFSETNGRFRKRRSATAAASLYTTAEDYARFVLAMLNDVGLKNETIAKMLTPEIDVDKNVYWGLGFGLEKTPNGKAFWQWGDYGIFRNYIVAYKEKKIGVVYFTNSFNGLSIGDEIVKHAIGGGNDLGLGFLGYDRFDSPARAFTKTMVDKGMKEAVKVFHELKNNHPDDVDEAAINRIGYTFLNAKKTKEAIEIFKLNVENYPDSANVYDSLAEAHMNDGDIDLAIKYYKKTLEMIPKDKKADKTTLENLKRGATEKLKELEAKKKKRE
ncbi:MAG: serine hydrolase [Candidatus Aminicenantes bacterium]|nr:MAG: serine hydrolase [Candidatus Aminicenantes bacterium]